jgi:hypothetical protein
MYCMKKISTSHDSGERLRQNYLLRKIDDGEDSESPGVNALIDIMKNSIENKRKNESMPEFQENNLEWDLRITDWILEKVRESEIYSQNLYAALCNRRFCRIEIISLIREEYWSCSWRYAGGIIADMREKGDYLDWYCSGSSEMGSIKNIVASDVKYQRSIVGEGHVTEEILQDLERLGWIAVADDLLN